MVTSALPKTTMLSCPHAPRSPAGVQPVPGRTNTTFLPAGDQSGYMAGPLVATSAIGMPVAPSRRVSLPLLLVRRRDPSGLNVPAADGVLAGAKFCAGFMTSTLPRVIGAPRSEVR